MSWELRKRILDNFERAKPDLENLISELKTKTTPNTQQVEISLIIDGVPDKAIYNLKENKWECIKIRVVKNGKDISKLPGQPQFTYMCNSENTKTRIYKIPKYLQ